MPVIVVGADTDLGGRIVDALLPHASELRAFVTDGSVGASLRSRGVKVAVGDVSDASHVGGAALNTFCAVLVPEAAFDDRERAFATSPGEVVRGWAAGLGEAGTRRAILIDDDRIADAVQMIAGAAPEVVVVSTSGTAMADVVAEVVRLEALETI